MVDAWADMAGTATLSASRTTLNNGLTRLSNLHLATTQPGNKVAGMLWADSSTNEVKIYDGSNWRVIVENYTAAQGGMPFLNSATFTTIVSGVAATGAAHFPIASQVNGQIQSMTMRIGSLSASADRFLWSIPVNNYYTISDVYIISDTASTGSSGSVSWTFQIVNKTASVNLLSTAKTTNGAEIAADTRYALGVDQNHTPGTGSGTLLDAGDVLELQITKAGGATTLAEVMVQVDYKVQVYT